MRKVIVGLGCLAGAVLSEISVGRLAAGNYHRHRTGVLLVDVLIMAFLAAAFIALYRIES